MGRLDPVELNVLAEHLRDEDWLDLRVVEHGIMERVLVEGVVIYRDSEDVDVRQDWVVNGVVQTANYLVSRDKIMVCRPTSFEVEDVTPVRLKAAAIQGVKEGRWAMVKEAAKSVLAMDEETFTYALDGIPLRYMLITAMYEISDESDLEICRRIGYMSLQPMISARYKVKTEGWVDNVRRIVALCEENGYPRQDRPRTIL